MKLEENRVITGQDSERWEKREGKTHENELRTLKKEEEREGRR